MGGAVAIPEIIGHKKLIIKEDKFLSSLIDYHPTIPKIYGLPKTHKPGIPLQPIISGVGTVDTTPHPPIITKSLA